MIKIRPYKEDRVILERFIVDFQDHERRLEPNRRPGIEIASDYLDYLLSKINQCGGLFVAEVDNLPAGYVCFWVDSDETLTHTNYLRVSDLYVDKTFRKRGIGRSLLGVAKEFGKAQGLKFIRLNVLAASVDSRTMYTTCGFREYEIVMENQIHDS